MEHSGKALLGIATAQGEDRVQQVLDEVLNCPLLENADISNAKNFLFFVTYGPTKKITMGELEVLSDRFEEMQSESVHVIWGHGLDETLGDNIKLSLVVTNFDTANEQKNEIIINNSEETIVSSTEENGQAVATDLNLEAATEQIEEPSVDTVMADNHYEQEVEADIPSVTDFHFPDSSSQNNSNFNGGDYDDDEIFARMVGEPAINRNELLASTQNKTQTAVEEPSAVYYELKDDVFDVFHGLAD